MIEEIDDKIVLQKGKTIFDYIGFLPNKGVSINEMMEKAVEKVAEENAKSIY